MCPKRKPGTASLASIHRVGFARRRPCLSPPEGGPPHLPHQGQATIVLVEHRADAYRPHEMGSNRERRTDGSASTCVKLVSALLFTVGRQRLEPWTDGLRVPINHFPAVPSHVDRRWRARFLVLVYRSLFQPIIPQSAHSAPSGRQPTEGSTDEHDYSSRPGRGRARLPGSTSGAWMT